MAPLNENSAGIFQMGANLVTSALPEEHKADMQMLGRGVGQILRNRFLTQQAEDFKQNELAAFMQKSSEFGTSLSMIEDPNQQVQALMDYKNSVMLPFITSTSMKYANNETIMNTAKTVFQMGPQLKDYIESGNLQNQTAQVGIDQQNADTQRMEALNRQKQLGLEAQRTEASLPINENMSSAEIEKRLRNMPGAERDSLDATTFESVATAYARAQGNRYDPQRNSQWNKNFQSFKDADGNIHQGDLDRAKAELSMNNDRLDRILFAGRGIARLGLTKFKEKFPDQYTDVLPYVTGVVDSGPEIEMKGAVPDNVIAGVFMNSPRSDDVNIDQFAEEIKSFTSSEQMGDRFFSAMESAITKDGKVLKVGGTDERLTFSDTDWQGNRTKLTKILKEQLKNQILDRIVSNDKSSLTTRRKVEKLIDTGIEQFLEDYADQHDIPIKKPMAAGRKAHEVVPSGSERLGILRPTRGQLLSDPSASGGLY